MIYYAAIGLISAATIVLEIALLRLFAVQQFYHFAFMAVSLALLGAGASGSILSIGWRHPRPAGSSLAFGLTTVGAYLIINYLPFDSFSIAWDSRQLLFLAIYFLAAAIPFLFSGLVVGGELMATDRDLGGSHQVYGASLIGSAAGSLASLLILAAVGGQGAIVLAAMLGALAALLFSIRGIRRPPGSYQRLTVVTLAVVLIGTGLAALLGRPAFLNQQLSPYKTLSVLSQVFDARHRLTEWNATARVDVIESSTIHNMPGLSLLSPVGLPPQVGLTLDGDRLMPITGMDPHSEQARALADFMPNGVAYHLRPGAYTLVIEAGTGMDVLFALAAGAERVTAVENNALVSSIVADEFETFTAGLYNDPRVEVVDQSGRVYARRSGRLLADLEPFDVTIIALTDPHRPVTSGAYSLTEDYGYTVEAFGDYLETIGDDGLLVVTRWLQTPPSESGRTFGALVSALQEKEMDPSAHLIAFRTLRTMTLLASPRPFSAEEIDIVRDYLRQRSFDPVYYEGIQPQDVNQYNVLQEPVYHDLFARLLSEPAAVYDDYRFDIRPTTDDRPFFFHYFKWRQTPEILAGLGLSWQPFGGSGFFVLIALLVLVGLASAVFIIGPLLLKRSRLSRQKSDGGPSWRPRVLVYFACLGLAFLFVEIPLAQRFILVLDQPVTALAVVLFTVLLFSGLGSLTVRRWQLSWGIGALVVLITLYPLLLAALTPVALGQTEWIRVGLTIAAIAPLGYLMGLPFAGGLQVVEAQEPALVPWAWAINGSFSVIGSVLAVMFALSWGFSTVLWLGAIAYAGALLSFRKLA